MRRKVIVVSLIVLSLLIAFFDKLFSAPPIHPVMSNNPPVWFTNASGTAYFMVTPERGLPVTPEKNTVFPVSIANVGSFSTFMIVEVANTASFPTAFEITNTASFPTAFEITNFASFPAKILVDINNTASFPTAFEITNPASFPTAFEVTNIASFPTTVTVSNIASTVFAPASFSYITVNPNISGFITTPAGTRKVSMQVTTLGKQVWYTIGSTSTAINGDNAELLTWTSDFECGENVTIAYTASEACKLVFRFARAQ